MKNKGNIWNEVLNIPSAQDPSAFHLDEDAKHKYISDSDDDQKGNKKQGKKQGKQGQKRKAKTKDATSEDNVKKTKQGRGKEEAKHLVSNLQVLPVPARQHKDRVHLH